MNRLLLTALLVCSAAAVTSGARNENSDFTRLQRNGIQIRKSSNTLPGQRLLPKTMESLNRVASKTQFTFPLESEIHSKEASAKQQMDSVVRKSTIGNNISKQIFTYNNQGEPLRADNFIADGNGGWILYNFYNYEYDNLNRIIMREMISSDNPYENVRYEYFYDNSTPYYTSQIIYCYDWESEEMIPFQKGEYVYDNEGRALEQSFFNWNNEEGIWNITGRETVSFDNLGRQTSYFQYSLEYTTGELVGENGETYIYVGDTETDAEVDGYLWENGDWLKYLRHIYTYEDGLLMKNEFLYWNRSNQDWSGNDTFGPFEILQNNVCNLYTYDEERRLIRTVGAQLNEEGEYVDTYEDNYTYTALENGRTEIELLQSFMWQGPYISPFKREIRHINSFGAECYYKNFSYMYGEEPRATSEEIRDIDDNNIYHGGVFYGFTNDEANTRYGQSKEEFLYAADWNGLTYTPCTGKHWTGTGYESDDTWQETTMDEFVWHDDIMIGQSHSQWMDGTPFKESQWETSFNYDRSAEDIIAWASSLDVYGADEYQLISFEQYYDFDYDGSWDTEGYAASYRDEYYYSAFDTSSVAAVPNPEAVEIARFDLMGHRIAEPTKGINIVRYSDGTSRKVFVAE